MGEAYMSKGIGIVLVLGLMPLGAVGLGAERQKVSRPMPQERFLNGVVGENILLKRHIDVDAPSSVYDEILRFSDEIKSFASEDLKLVLAAGKRNLQWIEKINKVRPETTQIKLSSAETQIGYPVEDPGYNNEEIVMRGFADWKVAAPQEMVARIAGTTEFGEETLVADAEFTKYARQVDRLYQKASRWLLQLPNLPYYTEMARADVRGIYFLSREPNLETKLRGFTSLSVADQQKYRSYLVGMCLNNEDAIPLNCQRQMEVAIQDQKVFEYFEMVYPAAKDFYDSFFLIQTARTDVTWLAVTPEVMSVPFAIPSSEAVLNWLRDNIEDEWKFAGWQLKLDFVQTNSPKTTHVEFQDGATPHVNGLAGSTITMDANRSLSEYNNRWTIRHEYGHVLGFPDCYIEFYDANQKVMVNYQLDTTNLMCSRRGHLLKTHFDELNRVYFDLPKGRSGN
jgi:hypothetical protein